jgi:hypothetical protein
LYWKAGAVSLLAGMFGWWAAHLLWLDQAGNNCWWLVSVLILALISTTFYANVFALQNYNVLGWLFLPITLYAWSNGLWILAALSILCASLCSITVTFLTCWLSLAYSLQIGSLLPIFTVIPSSIIIATHFYPLCKDGGLVGAVLYIFKAAGLTKKDVKYKRHKTMVFGLTRVYLLVVHSQFIICLFVFDHAISFLVMAAVIAWIVNSKLARFADDQSLFMLILSTATAVIIQSSTHNLWLLASFWILVSPVPLFARFFPGQSHLIVVPEFRPFDIEPILQRVESFLSPVKKGEHILMAFQDPQRDYSRLFDGYAVLREVSLYLCSSRDIHFIPDWFGVFELNYEGGPDFWGREVSDVERQIKSWGADYVIVYQPSGTKLQHKWSKAGFRSLGHFSWTQLKDHIGDVRIHSGPTPDWWLLRKQS